MTGALAVIGIIGARRRRQSSGRDRARWRARRDTKLGRIFDTITAALLDEGWSRVEVHESPLLTYTLIAWQHTTMGTFVARRRLSECLVLGSEATIVEYLVECFGRNWKDAQNSAEGAP